MIIRHYPPAVLVHVPECLEGSALPAVMASVLETGHDDQPADALFARCRVCYGTHGDDEPMPHLAI